MVELPSNTQQTDVPPTSQMSDLEKYGLPGLLAMIRNPSQDISSLAIGQDLTALGLDLNSSSPLHTQLLSPFSLQAPSRPLDMNFHIPACYNVANVQPLQQRISGLSEDTLFYIFYSMPRDIHQELVAEELNARKWRFHKAEKMWVTRDESYDAPREVEPGVSESGTYLWWDWQNWKKVRRSCVLRYSDLDDRTSRPNATQIGSSIMSRVAL